MKYTICKYVSIVLPSKVRAQITPKHLGVEQDAARPEEVATLVCKRHENNMQCQSIARAKYLAGLPRRSCFVASIRAFANRRPCQPVEKARTVLKLDIPTQAINSRPCKLFMARSRTTESAVK